ncbi:MAG: hypothetical protein NC548_32510 [Lachnospiraceae bacterium]|nr:hypothetical protein [Lachnospiraceae bacterium]
MELKDLFIGKIDAKNEPVDSERNKRRFIDGFLLPDNIDSSQFLSGDRYYIIGLKGTGKTALLKYIQLKIEQKNTQTLLILFKSDFSEGDKASFSRAAGCLIDAQTDEFKDFTDVWLWYIHRQIVEIIVKRNLIGCVFADNNDWRKYQACVLAPKLGEEASGISRLIPKLKRGMIELEGNFGAIKGKLGLDFDWADKSQTTVKFSDLVKQANALYQKLSPMEQPVSLYIFFDELELSFNQTKQYQTDIRLIRDIIVAINKINMISRQLHLPIYTITSIRSEVLNAIGISGKEINKPITDYGVVLKWPQKGDDSKNHPLMNIITKKISSSYKMLNMDSPTDDEIWTTFFPDRIGDKSIYEFILNKTWYRPRDIIRLLSIAQSQFPKSLGFSQNILETINKTYSSECWNEQIEELRAIYNEDELKGIKYMLLSLECPFSFIDIDRKCSSKKQYYDSVDKLLAKYKLADILSNLYRIGVIGNKGERMRFSFRGDDELLIERPMTIHPALWNYLSISNRSSINKD